MASHRGKCGEGGAGARYNKPMRVSVEVTNKGKCPVRVVLKDDEGQVVERKTIEPDDNDTVDGDDVVQVSIRCRGEEKDGVCRFTYSIDAE